MSNTIKAIETQYKGYRFRSRLEARWAVFFDALGVEWEYEKEGYDLGEYGWYLPDFWLPEIKSWVEIKPKNHEASDGFIKGLAALSSQFKSPILLISGAPGIDGDDGFMFQSFDVLLVAGYPHDRWHLGKGYENTRYMLCAEIDKSLQQWLATSTEQPVPQTVAEKVTRLDVGKDEDRQMLWMIYSNYFVSGGFKPITARSEDCSFAYNDGFSVICHSHGIAYSTVADALQNARSARFEHGEKPNV